MRFLFKWCILIFRKKISGVSCILPGHPLQMCTGNIKKWKYSKVIMAMWNEKSFIYSPVIVELIIVDFNRWCNRVETDYENLLAKFLDCSHFFFISATHVLRMFIYGFAITTTEWWKGNKQKIETLMQHSSHGGRQTLWHTLSTNVVMIKQSVFTYRNGYR